ncbi:hypothetical protein CDQ85_00540 [Clostridium thermosuccinogenes]|nr:hypothetical protein CDQ83_12175 [Pseudoclostridium thermosuccinogenes]PNU00207.1 hypothetical protein CDQ85_00540 [Pseudoclostridium thermosuccinogenes]
MSFLAGARLLRYGCCKIAFTRTAVLQIKYLVVLVPVFHTARYKSITSDPGGIVTGFLPFQIANFSYQVFGATL